MSYLPQASWPASRTHLAFALAHVVQERMDDLCSIGEEEAVSRSIGEKKGWERLERKEWKARRCQQRVQ